MMNQTLIFNSAGFEKDGGGMVIETEPFLVAWRVFIVENNNPNPSLFQFYSYLLSAENFLFPNLSGRNPSVYSFQAKFLNLVF